VGKQEHEEERRGSSRGAIEYGCSVRMKTPWEVVEGRGEQAVIIIIVNPIYRAKMSIYVTRSIGCGDLRSGQVNSHYCPKSCWGSGGCLCLV